MTWNLIIYGFAILGALCFQKEDPYEPKLRNVVQLPNVDRMCPGKPRGRL